MSIHICTHVYAEKLPQYAVFLRAHLSSLLLFRPDVPVDVTVCFTSTDDEVVDVLGDLMSQFDGRCHDIPLSQGELFRRSIGRNRVALTTRSDLVWFADVDYLFGEGCLDTLWDVWSKLETPKPTMIWPRNSYIHCSHAVGDVFWREHLDSKGTISPNMSAFIPKVNARAIGGIQIVGGDWAREHGYLNHLPQWQQPRTDGKPFRDFKDDVIYRRFCNQMGELKPIELPNLYRLRHLKKTY